MIRTTLVVLSLPFLLGIFKSTEGVSGAVGIPTNVELKTFPNNASRLCVVLQWTSICDSNVTICRTTLKVTTKGKSGQSSIVKSLFIPPTAADNRTKYQCVYDASKESSSCCAEIVKGLKAQDAINTPLSEQDVIEFEAKNCLNYSGNCAVGKPFSFVAPWKNPCLLTKPCGHYSQRCLTTKANEYNCTCEAGWEGRNCEILKGAPVMKDKCLANDIKAIKTESNKNPHDCLTACKATKDCRSFVFIPASASSKTGSCNLYNVNSKDGKVVSCAGKSLFDMTGGGEKPTAGAATAIGSLYAHLLVVIANMVALFNL